jgi:hypothetical protein
MDGPEPSVLVSRAACRALLVVVAGFAVAAAGCRRPQQPPPPPDASEQDRAAQIAHARHKAELASCAQSFVALTADPLQIALRNVFLYHDKQRFIIRDEAADTFYYGATACASALEDVANRTPPNNPQTLDPYAKVLVDRDGVIPTPYTEGVNCIYLLRLNGQPRAIVRPADSPDESCPRLSQPYSNVIPMSWSLPAGNPQHYPSTVRWDYHPQTRQMYLGVACGPHWCLVGLAEPSPAAQNPGPPSMSFKERVKGWNDEQYLGYLPGPGTKLRPSNLAARLVPHLNLENWWHGPGTCDVPTSELNKEYHAATIKIMGQDRPDDAALRFYEGTWWRLPPDTVVGGDSLHIMVTLTSQTSGNARYVHLRNQQIVGTSYGPLKVERREDDAATCAALRSLPRERFPHGPPGTARWGWSEDDESAWVRCGYGCCRISNDPL